MLRSLSALALLLLPLVSEAQTLLEVPIPTPNALIGGLAEGADGTVWFTEYNTNKIGSLSRSGTIAEYPLPTPNSGPLGLTAGPDGSIWFGELTANAIGRFRLPGVFDEFPLPANSRPQSLRIFNGALWFVESGRAAVARLGFDGDFTEVPLPAGHQPLQMVASADGALWVNDVGQIFRIAPNGEIRVIHFDPLPGGGGDNVEGMTAAPNGDVWFALRTSGRLGRAAADGAVTLFPVYKAADGTGGPTSVALGAGGTVWWNDAFAVVGRLMTDGTSSTLPLSNNPKARIGGPMRAPDGAIWFLNLTEGRLVRFSTAGDRWTFDVPHPGGDLGVAKMLSGGVLVFVEKDAFALLSLPSRRRAVER
jgi:virginiamycin B lyase